MKDISLKHLPQVQDVAMIMVILLFEEHHDTHAHDEDDDDDDDACRRIGGTCSQICPH